MSPREPIAATDWDRRQWARLIDARDSTAIAPKERSVEGDSRSRGAFARVLAGSTDGDNGNGSRASASGDAFR